MNNIENILTETCPDDFKQQLYTALKLAKKEFQDKKRSQGDKYIDHSIYTAIRLQKEGFDTATVIGGLLHHIDINKSNLEYITNNISIDIKKILTTYAQISTVIKNTDSPYRTVTRYILNSVDDLRPVIIQIFNAQSNSHILKSIENDEERKEIVERNLNIHSNLAEYLGFDDIKTDINEEAFRITQKEDYEYIDRLYKKENISKEKLEIYKQYIEKLLKDLKGQFRIEGRIKSKHSTFGKLDKFLKEGKRDPINHISDLIGIRIVCQRKQTCFNVLDKILDKAEISLDKFDDYISHPKPNGYKAMQGPVIFPKISSMMVEIQILTEDMYEYNTFGPASHIVYKESKKRLAKPSDQYKWIKEVQQSIQNNKNNSKKEFSIPITVKISENEIYPLTPQGKIIPLKKGYTITDFAYHIHTDIGNSMIGGKVNGKSVKFDYQLKTGDIVEIATQKGKKRPKPELIRYANSKRAQIKIERAIKQS